MQPFHKISGPAIPFGMANVDTDLILPAAFLSSLTREGLGEGAFRSLRYDLNGAERADSIFNISPYRQAPILLAGQNFGCGSSREHAVWALCQMGIKAVVAPSFADIFAANAFKNGLLTIVVPKEALLSWIAKGPEQEFSIDLEEQEVRLDGGERHCFEIERYRKDYLLRGLDEVAATQALDAEIARYEARARAVRPWLS